MTQWNYFFLLSRETLHEIKMGERPKKYIFSKTFRAGLHSQQNLEEGTCFDNEYMKHRLNKNTVMPSQLQLPTSQKIKLVGLITV